MSKHKRVNTPQDLERLKQYYREHKEEYTAYRKQWRADNPDKVRDALQRQSKSKATQQRKERIAGLITQVKAYYGCQNPDCPCIAPLPSYCLDFHHIEAETKKFSIGARDKGRSFQNVIAEMRKCTILCAVCHRMETWGTLDCSNFPKCHISDEGFPLV